MLFTTHTLAKHLRRKGVPVQIPYRHPVSHELNEEQLTKLKDALGDCSDWPKHTDDPRVNYAVDCLVSFEGRPPSFDEMASTYAEEIEAFKQLDSA